MTTMGSRGGFDIAVTEESWAGNEDRRWLGTRMGTDQNRSITLDVSTFDASHFTEKGALPSGLVLGKITATGKYGPYTGLTHEVVKFLESGSGLTSFTITYGGQTTASIDDDATAAQILAAVEALSNVAVGDFIATGSTVATGVNLSVNPDGPLKGTNIGAFTTTPTGGTGAVDVTVETAGGAEANNDGREVAAGFLFTTTKVGVGDGSDLATAADVGVALYWGPGIIKTAFLPAFSGTTDGELDANARTDLAHFIRFED